MINALARHPDDHARRGAPPRSTRSTRLGRLLFGAALLLLLAATSCQSLMSTNDPTLHSGATTEISCVGCHTQDYQGAKSPNHVTENLSTACESCHIKASWRPAKWDHKSWPLLGKHVDTTCTKCHGDDANRIAKPPRSCDGCHMPNYKAAKNPDHIAAALPTTCETCHTAKGWKPATWDHKTWPLLGKHATATCASCHKSGADYIGKPPRDCAGCHMPSYQKTNNPDHVAVQFAKTCETCHTPTGWKPSSWKHDSWPLFGKHTTASCAGCHKTAPNYVAKPTKTCDSCHMPSYQAAKNPDHVATVFPKTCETCHTPVGWKPSSWNHDSWPLVGKHATSTCSGCHKTAPNYVTKPTKTCDSCHMANYEAAKSPDHVGQVLPKTCQTCHTPVGWKPAKWKHDTWPLTGKHSQAICAGCHKSGAAYIAKPPTTCAGCHLPNYQATKSPDHVGQALPKTCQTCHKTTGWKPATWKHDTWPLTGKHSQTTCAKCHKVAPNYVPKPPTTCAGCHLPAYKTTKSPNHVAQSIPKTCATCHKTTGWKPATWKHDTWPLTGKHSQTTCAKCHKVAPNYVPKPPTTCAGCHLPNYQATKNPNHVAGGYPKACQTCHTTTAWQPAGMTNHTFPIKWGNHANIACKTCHTNTSSFKVFTCMSGGCHPKGNMDNKHLGEVSGYVYQATACLKCHPDGTKSDD